MSDNLKRIIGLFMYYELPYEYDSGSPSRVYCPSKRFYGFWIEDTKGSKLYYHTISKNTSYQNKYYTIDEIEKYFISKIKK